jgi:hypothetical protein
MLRTWGVQCSPLIGDDTACSRSCGYEDGWHLDIAPGDMLRAPWQPGLFADGEERNDESVLLSINRDTKILAVQ